MLKPRLIPCLLLKDGALHKTVRFRPGKYVGDPLNAVRIFNEKEADELMVLDIDCTVARRRPNFSLLAKLAAECRMPLAYGGGVTSEADFEQLVALGVEKIAVSTMFFQNPAVIGRAAERVGRQSVVVVLDVKKAGGRYSTYVSNGKTPTGVGLEDAIVRANDVGAGEIVVNSIDHDGVMDGYDLQLGEIARGLAKVPLTIMGGGKDLQDVATLWSKVGHVGAAAGSMFVFKGSFKAVLISYPNRVERERLGVKPLTGPAASTPTR